MENINRILIIFAHPLLEKSIVNKKLIDSIPDSPNITVRDLYELYPDFNIDVESEQNALLSHDIIIWQHPMYWYSCPPLLKQWIDMVLEHNWAYGKDGDKLKNKHVLQTITTGGSKENYSDLGKNQFSLQQLLKPFYLTAKICSMSYLPPFVTHGTHSIEKEDLTTNATNYRAFLVHLIEDKIDFQFLKTQPTSNDWVKKQNT